MNKKLAEEIASFIEQTHWYKISSLQMKINEQQNNATIELHGKGNGITYSHDDLTAIIGIEVLYDLTMYMENDKRSNSIHIKFI